MTAVVAPLKKVNVSMLGHDAVYPVATPRRLSPLLIGHLFVAGKLLQYGFVPLSIGIAFFYCAMPTIATSSALHGHLISSVGSVSVSRDTGRTSGSTPIYENRYSFVASDGSRHSGLSYGPAINLGNAQPVEVLYPENNPSVSVIAGMSATTVPLALAYASLIPFFIGLAMVLTGWAENYRTYCLIRRGQFGSAVMVGKDETKQTVNQHPVYAYTYEFAAPGGNVRLLRTATFEWLDDHQQLLYLPGHKTECILTCSIPGNASVGPLTASARLPLFQSLLIPLASGVIALAIIVACQ